MNTNREFKSGKYGEDTPSNGHLLFIMDLNTAPHSDSVY